MVRAPTEAEDRFNTITIVNNTALDAASKPTPLMQKESFISL